MSTLHVSNELVVHHQEFIIVHCITLRHCATSQKVVGSIPDGVIGIFH